MFYRLFAVVSAVWLAASLSAADAGESGNQRSKPLMSVEWSKVVSPFLDTEPEVSVRDPLLVYNEGIFRCFYSAVERKDGNFTFFLETIESPDLVHWSKPRRLTHSHLGFSSPGNIFKHGREWVMSLQTYPVPAGEKHASEEARLWIMKSPDLVNWGVPKQINPDGAKVNWSASKRQIDPCIIEHDGKYWCLYKTSGSLGLLVSDDLKSWREASPDRPVLSKDNTPDNKGMENPCIIRDGDDYVLFFAAVRNGRGIGVTRSKDLLHWRDVHYLQFPKFSWATSEPTAAQVTDLRDVCGKYVMVFHAERKEFHTHAAALGIAWSDDLEHWEMAR